MVRQEGQRVVTIPHGSSEELSVYINGELYDAVFNFSVSKYLDRVWIFDAIVPGSNRDDSNLLRGNTVKIFIGNDIFLKGTIETSSYNTRYNTKISGIGFVAYKLRERIVKQNEVNKSYYENKTSAYVVDHLCSENLDGSSPWLVTTNHVDTYPSIFVRMDNENRLNGIMGTTKACDYNWYESWGSFPWNDGVMNIAENKGSLSSTFTFEVSGDSQNTIDTTREEDRDKLYNDITILGYGDGVNQKKSRIYHATLNRTYLTADMTKDGIETINVADATSLPSSGNVWIGCEKVSYTGKTGTTLTGITRGVAFMSGTNVTESYVHTKHVTVYDAQYTTTSAETDSSIGDGTELNDANWGIEEKTFSDNSIVDQNTLDKIAGYLLDEHKDIIISINVTPMEIYETMDAITLGDMVTINDADAGYTGDDFRVIGIELGMDDAIPYLRIICSSVYRNINEVLKIAEDEAKKLSVYMQGAPNIISVQSYENAQQSTPVETGAMKMKFRVWDKTIAIQEATLDMKILPFRGYTSTTSSTTTSDGTNIASSTFNAAGLAYVTYHKLDYIDVGYTGITTKIPININSSGYVTSWYNTTSIPYADAWTQKNHWTWFSNPGPCVKVPDVDAGTFRKTRFIGTLTNNFSSTRTFNWSLRLSSRTGTVLNSGSKSLTADESYTFEAFDSSNNYIGYSVYLVITNQTFNATDEADSSQVELTAYTYANQSHTHPMVYGITEDTDNPTVKVQIGDDDNWAATKGYINSGSAYSYGTHNNIDISSELKSLMGDLSSTKRIRIQFEPQGSGNTCRIEANADVFVFLGSV